jgi:hypothetical protein
MSTDPGARPPGHRNNGLAAPTFFSLGDVDPRIGEHLLDVLYLNGIAAYLQPTVDYDAVTRAALLPRQPSDRLWVDGRRADEARALMAAEAAASGRAGDPPPSEEPVDEDLAWNEIVAFFDKETAAPVPPWPVNEDADEPHDRRRDDDDAPAAPAGTGVVEETAAEEEGYVPPPPPPLPRISKGTAGAVVAIVFGLVVLFTRSLFSDPDLALTLSILAVVGGVGYLIWHMQDGPPGEDRPDDGAVV